MHDDERGQSTVELALLLPLIAAVLGALVELGLLFADRARLMHAAREAARVAVVDADPGAVRAAAEATGLNGLEMSVTPAPSNRRQGDPLTVDLRYHPEGRIPLVGELFERLELQASATMRVEVP